MCPIKQLRLDIAASLYMLPCTEDELCKREFLNDYWVGHVQRFIMELEKDAIYYRGEVIHIKKSWAMKHLKSYDIDFRSDRQKLIDSMSAFKRSALGL
jgi:hypothetical protein